MNYLSILIEHIAKLFRWWVIVLPWEQGIRVRMGKHEKLLSSGVYFRIPYFDTVVVRSTRSRMVSLSVQTVQTKDGHVVSFLMSCGYAVTDIRKLYRTLYHPDATVGSLVMSSAAEFISENNLSDITPRKIEHAVINKIKAEQYGLGKFQSTVQGFATVRTYRLIQDSSWLPVDRGDDEKDSVR